MSYTSTNGACLNIGMEWIPAYVEKQGLFVFEEECHATIQEE